MQLPKYLQEKINALYLNLNKEVLVKTRQNLTARYKTQTGRSESLISSKEDSVLYAISRMPATYAVIYSLLSTLYSQNLLKNFSTCLDVGSGTGAGYFALKEFDNSLKISLFERDDNMISIFNKLTDDLIEVDKGDLLKNEINSADLVISSYVLSELNEKDRKNAVNKLLKSTNKYLLLIDTGTPEVYRQMMQIKDYVLNEGWYVVAPCNHKKCTLKNDYCQFFVRIERSALLKMSKKANLSYEDEKYFYLLISKDINHKDCNNRIIRRPLIKTNEIELMLCKSDGVKMQKITKNNKNIYKIAKKVKINDFFN